MPQIVDGHLSFSLIISFGIGHIKVKLQMTQRLMPNSMWNNKGILIKKWKMTNLTSEVNA